MVNICPVCGYGMKSPAADYHICPCCGTEFGYDDAGRDHAELRANWLRSGAKWWSPLDSPPAGWDPYRQVNQVIYSAPLWGCLLHSANQATPDLGVFQAMAGGKQTTAQNPVPLPQGQNMRQIGWN